MDVPEPVSEPVARAPVLEAVLAAVETIGVTAVVHLGRRWG